MVQMELELQHIADVCCARFSPCCQLMKLLQNVYGRHESPIMIPPRAANRVESSRAKHRRHVLQGLFPWATNQASKRAQLRLESRINLDNNESSGRGLQMYFSGFHLIAHMRSTNRNKKKLRKPGSLTNSIGVYCSPHTVTVAFTRIKIHKA
jgi:hypothetical protein